MSKEMILDHADHGAIVVYSDGEATEMAKKGWLKRPSKNTPDKALALLGFERDGDKIVAKSASNEEIEETVTPVVTKRKAK